MSSVTSITSIAVDILTTADPWQKVAKTRVAARQCAKVPIGAERPPDRPARPSRPELSRPAAMAKRSTGPKGRIALVHALAHIELNAVDLAWDIVARFADCEMPRAFFDDWIAVAAEEAEHFYVLDRQLKDWGHAYGDFPAHDGLWLAAQSTADDLLARLAIIPLTLEARGLDTTPTTTAKLRAASENSTADILDVIYHDEIKHLSIGVHWFKYLCGRRQLDPPTAYRHLVAQRFKGTLKGPFNLSAREQAGMPATFLAQSTHM